MASACEAAAPVLPGLLDQALGAITSESVRGVLDDAFFYCAVREFVINGIILGPYRELVAVRLAQALGVLSMVVVTLWVAVQGFQLLSGQARQAALPLIYRTARLVLVLSLVSLLAKESPYVVESVENFKDLISQAVTDGSDVTALIDANLGITAMLSSINDAIRSVESQRDTNVVTSTVGLLGQSGPAMLTATLLLLTELSVTLAIMLAPVFVFFLVFQQTAPLFWSWAKFLLGALFSMATLTLVASLALQATALYGASVVAAFYTNSGDGLGGMINAFAGGPFDINASSLRLAALGTLMTAIIVSVPPVIMSFFGAAAAFTTGAMVSMGGAGMLAQQMGAGRSAGMGVPALGGPQGGPSGAAGGTGPGSLLPHQQSPESLNSQNATHLQVGGRGQAPSLSGQTMQQISGRLPGAGDVTDVTPRLASLAGRHGLASEPATGTSVMDRTTAGLRDVQDRQNGHAEEFRSGDAQVPKVLKVQGEQGHGLPSLAAAGGSISEPGPGGSMAGAGSAFPGTDSSGSVRTAAQVQSAPRRPGLPYGQTPTRSA